MDQTDRSSHRQINKADSPFYDTVGRCSLQRPTFVSRIPFLKQGLNIDGIIGDHKPFAEQVEAQAWEFSLLHFFTQSVRCQFVCSALKTKTLNSPFPVKKNYKVVFLLLDV